MLKLKEDLLHFIWQNKLYQPGPYFTTSGKELSILKAGERNRDAGPDFFNASVRIEELVLAGNIEMHVRTSDWLKHGHAADKNYDNLILHVVYEHDVELEQNRRHRVEVLELKQYIARHTLETYRQLSENGNRLPCSTQLDKVDSLRFAAWLERMTIERLEEKVDSINSYFEAWNSDYSQTFYGLLLRSFGLPVNALPFELLAKHLPFYVLLKHADNLQHLEALLMGSCGMLEEHYKDDYIRNLQNEFAYLKTKYNLVPVEKSIFKFSRMRPASFPNTRLAQLAALIHHYPELITSPYLHTEQKLLQNLLRVKPSAYWKSHYRMDGRQLNKENTLGASFAETLIINAFAPFLFFYGRKTSRPEFEASALRLLDECSFELNAKTKLFSARREAFGNSTRSQAIIHLYDNYCLSKKCLKCGIAAAILKPD